MIILSWEHVACGTINPERVENIRIDQGTFKITAVIIPCTGCDKEVIVTNLIDIEEVQTVKQKK